MERKLSGHRAAAIEHLSPSARLSPTPDPGSTHGTVARIGHATYSKASPKLQQQRSLAPHPHPGRLLLASRKETPRRSAANLPASDAPPVLQNAHKPLPGGDGASHPPPSLAPNSLGPPRRGHGHPPGAKHNRRCETAVSVPSRQPSPRQVKRNTPAAEGRLAPPFGAGHSLYLPGKRLAKPHYCSSSGCNPRLPTSDCRYSGEATLTLSAWTRVRRDAKPSLSATTALSARSRNS